MHRTIEFLLLCLCSAAAAFDDPLLVELPHGTLRGRDNEGYYSYESIPYAEPPLGELRFAAPQPYSQHWTEVFDATKPPVPCLQWDLYTDKEDKLLGKEDCLTVSVYKPKNSSRSSFPVLVNIHGGGFSFGDTLGQGHNFLMDSGNLIMVKISYRLGPLGFVSTGDAVLPGNFGLKDQRLALEWIKENIGRFGGEPENIVLLGCSAGGASVHLQLLQEDFGQLVKVAVSISGNALDPWVVQDGARRRAFEVGRIAGCGLLSDSTELRECLRHKDAADIVRAMRDLQVFDYVPFTPFGPVVEPKDAHRPFLTQRPIDIIRSGKFSQVPWLTSFTEQDGSFNAAALLKKQPNGQELMEELNNRWFELAPHLFFYRDRLKTIEEMDDYSRALRQQYLGDRRFSVANYLDVQRIFTDLIFRNETIRAVDLHRKHGKSPLYLYVYDTPADRGSAQRMAQRNDFKHGAGHEDDHFLILDNQFRMPLRPDEQVISKNLIRMVEDFVQSIDGSLTYADCVFPNNVGQGLLHYVAIRSGCCEISTLDPVV